MTPAPVSRRRAMVLGGLGAAAVAAGTAGWIASGGGAATGGRFAPADTGAELTQPPLRDSRDGRLQVEITAAAGVQVAGRKTHALKLQRHLPWSDAAGPARR